MRCSKHPEVEIVENCCPICSDEVDFWPVADWDSTELRNAIKSLPIKKRTRQPNRSPSLKYPITW